MATPIKLKRSAVEGKRPGLSNLELGELALNTYDGSIYVQRDTEGVGIATTIANVTPWTENYGAGSIYYTGIGTTGKVGIGTTNPQGSLQIGTGVTVYGSTGIVSATQFYGDGTNEKLIISGGLGAGAGVVLSSQNLNLVGTDNEINTSADGQQVQIGLPNNVTISNDLIVGAGLSVVGITTLSDVLNVGTAITVSAGIISATKFIPSGGNSTQFLKGDGSLDGQGYLIAETSDLNDVLVRGNVSGIGISVGVSTLGNVSNGLVELYHNSNLVFRTVGTGVSIANAGLNTATIYGPEEIHIDPSPIGVGTTSGIVRIKGDLYVDGTEFIVNSETITLGDFVVGIATTATTNALTDGAGIGIGSIGGEKTFKYYYNSGTNPSLKSSENLNVASEKGYQIDQTEVLSATTLGSGVTESSLTSVGTLGSLNVSGTTTFNDNVSLKDDDELMFGDSDDLKIYHTSVGNTSYIDNRTGSLYIRNNVITDVGGDIVIEALKDETSILCEHNATVKLYYDNVEKLATTSDGIDITGTIVGTALSVSGVTTVGFATATDVWVSGAVTATTFKGTLDGNATSATSASGLTGSPDITVGTIVGTALSVSGIATVTDTLKVGTGITAHAGIITATSFSGSGTNLTGIVTSIVAGSNITISGATGQVTINSSGGGASGLWASNDTGINTSTNVGIATTNPLADLQVGIGVTIDGNSGIISATTFKGSLDGNAGTATSLATARTIAGVSFDGTANIDIPYSGLTSPPTIPTNNNELTNGAGYITASDSISGNAAGLTGSPDITVGTIVGTALSVSGIATVTDTLKVGTGITAHAGIITATKFVKSSGTSTQFLKADGTVDSSTYLTSYTETSTLDDVLGRGNSSTKGMNVGISTLGNVSDGFVKLYHDSKLVFQTVGSGVSVVNGTGNTATIYGPEEIWIDPHPAGVGTTSGIVRIRGDLYVDGTEFIVDVEKLEIGDFQIGIATTAGTNALLDGAGIGIGSTGIRKTITWNNATDALMTSENWNLASGKHYEIAGTDVLTSTTLGSGVLNSSLTSVGTLGSLKVTGVTTVGFATATDVWVSGAVTATTFKGTLDGNAGTATSLATARTIAGVSFDGTANIDIPYSGLTSPPTIPTNNNELTNGAGYITASDNTSGTAGGLTGTPDITVGTIVGTALSFSGISTFSDNTIIGGSLTVGDGASITGGSPTDQGNLAVYGTGKNSLIIQATTNSSSRGMAFRNSGDAYVSYISAENVGSNLVDLTFGVADSAPASVDSVEERMRITKDGNIGIGTTNPTGATALTDNEATLAVGIATVNKVYSPIYYAPGGATKNKFIVWSSSAYAIGMDDAMSFGGLNDYAMTFKMNNDDDRGWWWGDGSHSDAQGAMTLNTIGELVVAKSIRAGGGESDTSAPRKPLDIIGDGIISGDVGIGTTNPTGAAALTSNEKVLAVGVVTANTLYVNGTEVTGGGGGGASGLWASNDTGINTSTNVGIATTTASAMLEIGSSGVATATTLINTKAWDGQTFNVDGNITSDSIFAVNDISGLPVIDYNATSGKLALAPFGGNVSIGYTNSGTKLGIKGSTSERVYVSTGSSLSNVSNDQINIDNGNVQYYSVPETGGDLTAVDITSNNGLNNDMAVGDSVTVVVIIKPDSADDKITGLEIDGSAVTEEWLGGSTPTGGASGTYDVYTFFILKTADATFLPLCNKVNFA